jgi:hypothetical protein
VRENSKNIRLAPTVTPPLLHWTPGSDESQIFVVFGIFVEWGDGGQGRSQLVGTIFSTISKNKGLKEVESNTWKNGWIASIFITRMQIFIEFLQCIS